MEPRHPTARAPRKHKRKCNGNTVADGSDETWKGTGQPKKDTVDESAEDRRRTQIRMAQRAYRQRKETTLEDLRQRVCGLTSVAEFMNKSFEDLRDRLVSAGLSESQLDELAEVSVLFVDSLKAVRKLGDAQSEALVGTDLTTSHLSLSSTRSEEPHGDHVSSWIDQTALNHPERPAQPSDVGLGYRSISPGLLD